LAPPGPAGGATSVLPDPLAAFDGHTSKKGGGKERKGKGRGDATHPVWKIPSYATE